MPLWFYFVLLMCRVARVATDAVGLSVPAAALFALSIHLLSGVPFGPLANLRRGLINHEPVLFSSCAVCHASAHGLVHTMRYFGPGVELASNVVAWFCPALGWRAVLLPFCPCWIQVPRPALHSHRTSLPKDLRALVTKPFSESAHPRFMCYPLPSAVTFTHSTRQMHRQFAMFWPFYAAGPWVLARAFTPRGRLASPHSHITLGPVRCHFLERPIPESGLVPACTLPLSRPHCRAHEGRAGP
jgi:hypothetical protein